MMMMKAWKKRTMMETVMTALIETVTVDDSDDNLDNYQCFGISIFPQHTVLCLTALMFH